MADNQQPSMPSGTIDDRVCAVVVSYFPDLARLDALLESVRAQAAMTVIVDNGSGAEALAEIRRMAQRATVKLIEFGENRGIGAAHNAGIRYAMENGFAYVLLLDHDSCLSRDCVPQLLQASKRLSDAGMKVAAVGPQY